MSKSYIKACDYCKQQIQMSDKDGGRWLPYNLNNGLHDCRTNGNGKDNNNSKGKEKSSKKDVNLEQVQKKLESIGIIINVEKLMNQK